MAVRVIGAAVQVVVGKRAHVVLSGGLLPDDTSPEDVDRLVRKGLAVVDEELAPEPEPEKQPRARKPAAK